MADVRHWVEDLFPPVYPIDSAEVLGGAGGQDREDENPRPGTSVYEIAAKRISRYDPATIKNVYERVWLLSTVQEQERERREQEEEDKALKEAELAEAEKQRRIHHRDQRLTGGDPTGTLVLDALKLTDQELPTPKGRYSTIDTEDSSLWTSEELGVLREVFSAARKENIRLKVALEDAEQRVDKLEKRYEKKSSVLTQQENVLAEAKKANKRLQVLIASLKRDVGELETETQGLRDDLEDMREQKVEVEKELHELRKESDAERIRRENLEIDLEDCQQVAARQLELHEERLTLRHTHKVAALEKQIKVLREELGTERKDHARTKKGLEHLQKHFSALPLQSVDKKQTMVTENELKNWSY